MTAAELGAVVSEAYQRRIRGEFAEALELLRPVLRLPHPPATALQVAAECLNMVSEPSDPEPEDLLRLAVKLAPDAPDCRLELAFELLACESGVSPEVYSLSAEARRLIDALDASAMLLSVSILEEEGRPEDAIRLAEEALAKHPKSRSLANKLQDLRAAGHE